MKTIRNALLSGLHWLVARLEEPGSPEIVFGSPRPTTPTDKDWDKALSDYLVVVAEKTRAAATAWGTSATGLLAVVGLASFFKGRETIDGVDPAFRPLITALIVGTLIGSFLTLYAAALASQGHPRTLLLSPSGFRAAQLASAERSGRWLRISRRLAVISFVLALSAMTAILSGPKPPTVPSLTLVVGGLDGHELACGELSVANGRLLVGGLPLPEPPIAFHSVKDCGDP